MTELTSDVRAAIETRIAKTVGARVDQVRAAVTLLDEGATVPFIARYRKEATGGLDDTQLRDLQEKLIYQRELEERRAAILTALSESGKLTEELERDIWGADTKQRLEDLYLPYKPKRRTRAQIAREAGLEPLAKLLWEDPLRDPETEAEAFVNADKGVADVRAALDGARDILAEIFYENADMLEELREFLWKKAYLVSKVVPEKETDPAAAKYSDYFDYDEPIETVPSHRALAVFRGRQEGLLTVKVLLTEEEEALPAPRSYTPEERDALQSDPNLEEILFLAERYIRHPLSSKDMETIIYWYDGLKLPADLIEYLIESCVDKGHVSIHYMNKVALNWAANHFSSVEEAKQSASIHSQAYYAVMKAFGISGRSLAEAEGSYVEKWTRTYGFTLDIITEACKRTILNIQKPSFPYADALLTSWHDQKVHHLEDIARLDQANTRKPAKKSDQKGGGQNRFHNFSQRQYDYDALEQQLLRK